MKHTITIVFAALVALQPAMTSGFSIDGATWNGAGTTLRLHPISFPSGNVFTANALLAMGDWNAVVGSNFRFISATAPCNQRDSGDGINCITFVSGSSLGSGVLASTRVTEVSGLLFDTDVMFNVDRSWVAGVNVGDFSSGAPFPFRGVARHEFGHVLGLCHEDGAGRVVLMNSRYGAGMVKPANPHWDDRNGVRSLYPATGSERDLIAYMWKRPSDGGSGCKSSSTASRPVSSVTPTSVTAGDPVAIEFSFENAGNLGSGSFDIAFLLSTDNLITLSDVLIGQNTGASASAHSGATQDRILTVPPGTPLGNFFLGVCLDVNNAVAESNESNNCHVAPGSITVVAASPTATLSVSKRPGSGSGTITSSPAGINCGSDCSETYAGGTTVTLTPTPQVGSVFTMWFGDPDCEDGVVTLNLSKSCEALFERTDL